MAGFNALQGRADRVLKPLIGNAAWALASHLLSRGMLTVSAMLLARWLDTPGFASYGYFQMTAATFSVYGSVGLGVAASRYFAAHGSQESDNPPPLGFLLVLGWVMAAVASIVVLLLPDKAIQSQLQIPHWLLSVAVLAIVAGVVPAGATLGLEKFKQVVAVSAISASTMLGGALLAGWSQSPMLAMVFLTLAFAVQSVGETAITLAAVGKEGLRLPATLEGMRAELGKVLAVAGPMTLVSLLSASGAWLVGRILLSAPDGAHGFALYSIGMQWFALALLIPGITSRVLLPKFVREGDHRKSRGLLWHGVALAVAASTAGLLFFGSLGPWLMRLYGEAYAAPPWFLAAFLGAAVLSAPANPIGNAIVAKDGQIAWLLLSSGSFLVLMSVAWLARGIGPLAGALAQGVAAFLLSSAAMMVFLRRKHPA